MTDRDIMQQALKALEANLGNWAAKTKAIAALRERLAQPEQEPVAWLYRDAWGTMKLSQVTPPPVGAFPVYTAPPQRKPLRDHEIAKILDRERMKWNKSPPTHEFDLAFARAIEAAHGINAQDPMSLFDDWDKDWTK